MADPSKSSIGSFIKAYAVYGDTMTAAGTGDNTERTSGSLDVLGYGSGSLIIAGRTTAATGETLKATVKISSAPDDGSGAAGTYDSDTTLVTATTVATGGASAQNFVYKLDIDLGPYKKFARFKITMDLSASGTDTAQWGATFVAGGATTLPAA